MSPILPPNPDDVPPPGKPKWEWMVSHVLRAPGWRSGVFFCRFRGMEGKGAYWVRYPLWTIAVEAFGWYVQVWRWTERRGGA